jgi:hypothetical protein
MTIRGFICGVCAGAIALAMLVVASHDARSGTQDRDGSVTQTRDGMTGQQDRDGMAPRAKDAGVRGGDY